MISAFLIGGALAMMQASAPAMIEDNSPAVAVSEQGHGAAYDALAAGRSGEALVVLERALAAHPEDPALLINLAAASLAEGDYQRAADAYRRAAASEDRYLLELADGSWMDSRIAARRGLQAMQRGTLVASR